MRISKTLQLNWLAHFSISNKDIYSSNPLSSIIIIKLCVYIYIYVYDEGDQIVMTKYEPLFKYAILFMWHTVTTWISIQSNSRSNSYYKERKIRLYISTEGC